MKLGVVKKGFDPYNFKAAEAWKTGPPRRMVPWKIRCYLFQCKDIPAADDDGSSDPFVRIWNMNKDGKKIETDVIDDNLNPIFMTTKDFVYDFSETKGADPF